MMSLEPEGEGRGSRRPECGRRVQPLASSALCGVGTLSTHKGMDLTKQNTFLSL